MKVARRLFEKMTSLVALFDSWHQFTRGKRKRQDVQGFERHLEDHLFNLQHELVTLTYRHGPYDHFYVADPKQRYISRASVRDRLVHQVVYGTLSKIFDRTFFFHSLSCRVNKGAHLGVSALKRMARKVSSKGSCFALKMDIQCFFDSVDHQILKQLLRKTIKDDHALQLTDRIIDSFRSGYEATGLPLGNVTSQLFANLYLNELELYVKHTLREPHYLRYCDDFILVSHCEAHLRSLIDPIKQFLKSTLHLELHPKKTSLRPLHQGVDFVGYVLFPHHTLVRHRTKQRMKRCLKQAFLLYEEGEVDPLYVDQRLQSTLGILSHAQEHTLSTALQNIYGVRPVKF